MGIHGRDAAWRRALCASLASPSAAPAPAALGSAMAFVLDADARGFQFFAFGTRRPWANGAPLVGERAMVKQLHIVVVGGGLGGSALAKAMPVRML